jgi:hypothetical protein
MLPSVLVLQLFIAWLMFLMGRWKWLTAYLCAIPVIWFVALMLYSAHCVPCGHAIWILPLLILFVAAIKKFA